MFKFILVLLLMQVFVGLSQQEEKPKNIVIIMADDLGYDDVSFRGSNEIPTPNIDALAYNSVILNRFYTPPLCTPSRASMLTGKYPHHTGLQDMVIVQNEPYGMSTSEKILPEYLKEAGYRTSLVGKWHLGFYKKEYAPNQRGFDSYFGYLGSHLDYYDYSLSLNGGTKGYDLRRNEELVNPRPNGTYVTELLTDEAVDIIEKNANSPKPFFLLLNHLAPHAADEEHPLQAPEEEIAKFTNITDPKRKILAAMITMLDKSVGKIVSTLVKNAILKNTVIMFYSDNGGPTIQSHETRASNYPLRGQKGKYWEGSVRTNAFIFSPDLEPAVRNQYFHVSDILPTIASIANFTLDTPIDGVNQWEMLKTGQSSPRKHLTNIDDINRYGYLIHDNYKFVNGSTVFDGIIDTWLSQRNPSPGLDDLNYSYKVIKSPAHFALISSNSSRNLLLNYDKMMTMRDQASVVCNRNATSEACNLKADGLCLFDIIKDPCEYNNLANSHPTELADMKKRFADELATAIPSRKIKGDPLAEPKFWNNTWTYWKEGLAGM